jgi:hypothetical protein
MPFILVPSLLHQFRLTLTRTSGHDSKEFHASATIHVTAAASTSDASSSSMEWSGQWHFLAPLVNSAGVIAANQLVFVSSLATSRNAFFSGLRITKTR